MSIEAEARHLAADAASGMNGSHPIIEPEPGLDRAAERAAGRAVDLGAATPTVDAPTRGGWAAAATAVHAVRLVAAPVVLRLVVADHATILIDVRYRAYRWGVPLDRFPVDAEFVDVHTKPLAPDAPPVFELPGEDLDGLLWTMGLHAFGDGPAGWMRPGDRHRLARWPNFTELAHTADQLRMTAMLGNAFFTAEELASAAGTRPAEAQRLLNALGLMDSLRASEGDVAPPPVLLDARTERPRGLFGRLRARLGR